jgi:23S rRNA pseudouridine2457 synthase
MMKVSIRVVLAFRYLLFNKPFNVLSQFTTDCANSRKRTLGDFIRVPHVYPAGRLDFDSEGLLLLTDDGEFQHRISEPRYGHPRTYWAQVEGIISEDAVAQLRTGVVIQGYRTKPAQACAIEKPNLPPREPPIRFRKNVPTSWLELTLTEGRNRQVRRMTAAVGIPTLRLVRSAIGDLTLERLAPGEWRELDRSEVDHILARLSRAQPIRARRRVR